MKFNGNLLLKQASNLNPAVNEESKSALIVERIIAIWGFNEAVFGGILHALKIPFTGLFIGSIAVILITLIAHYSKDKSVILKATFIVILVKGIVSPYTPLTAYFAVSIQGITGYILFKFVSYEPGASVILGFISLLNSALQKVIITTLFFGTTFWKSIDLFSDYVFSQIKIFPNHKAFSVSLILISIYTIIHVAAGIIAGLKAVKIPSKLNDERILLLKKEFEASDVELLNNKRKEIHKRSWWKKPSRILLLVFLAGLLITTYFFPLAGKNYAYEIFIMILRAALIFIVWYLILSFPIKVYLSKIIEKNKFKHAVEIERITGLFPVFRRVINYCWKNSGMFKGVKRIRRFISDSIVLLLICDL